MGRSSQGKLPDTLPTRQVCTVVYLNESLRREILDGFFLFPYWAWAPSYELDMVAVVRHARLAHRLRVERDAVLSAILAATTAAVCYLLGRHGALWLAVVVGLAAFAALGLTFASERLRSHMRGWTERLRGDVWSVLLLLLAVLVFAAVVRRTIGWDHGLSMCLAVLAAGTVSALFVVGAYAYLEQDCARAVWLADRGLADLAPLAPPWIERRLCDLENANLLTYDHARRVTDTMVGAGQEFYEWHVTVDTQQRPPDFVPDKTRPTPTPIEPIGLHESLKNAVARVPGSTCEYRVYADGQGLYHRTKALLEARFGPPKTSLPVGEVHRWLERPGRLTRTYLCLQASSPEGELVVTTFVRGSIADDYLHLRVRIFVLPPVALAAQALSALPMTQFHSVALPVFRAIRATPALVLMSPRSLMSTAMSPLGRWRQRWLHRRRVRRDLLYDLGAVESLRERLAVGEHMHSNAWDDALRTSSVVQVELFRALVEYLDTRGIETSGLREEAKMIINGFRTVVQRVTSKNIPFAPRSRDDGVDVAPPPPSTPPAAPAPGPAPDPAGWGARRNRRLLPQSRTSVTPVSSPRANLRQR